jgi:hypothetical protein
VHMVGPQEDGARRLMTSSPGKKCLSGKPVHRVQQPVARARTGRWMTRVTQWGFRPAQMAEEVVEWWCSLTNRVGGREHNQWGQCGVGAEVVKRKSGYRPCAHFIGMRGGE